MALNPRMLASNVQITWDGVVTNIPAGTVVDVPAGSALETAYGLANLVPLTGQQTGGTSSPQPLVSGEATTQ